MFDKRKKNQHDLNMTFDTLTSYDEILKNIQLSLNGKFSYISHKTTFVYNLK